MKVSPNWRKFIEMLNRALPKWGELPLMDYGEKVAEERQSKKSGPTT